MTTGETPQSAWMNWMLAALSSAKVAGDSPGSKRGSKMNSSVKLWGRSERRGSSTAKSLFTGKIDERNRDRILNFELHRKIVLREERRFCARDICRNDGLKPPAK